jgi:hypothetical protein
MKYQPVKDGDWMHLPRAGMLLACCDCALIHDIAVKVVNGKIYLRVKRHERATAAMRRPFKFAKDGD